MRSAWPLEMIIFNNDRVRNNNHLLLHIHRVADVLSIGYIAVVHVAGYRLQNIVETGIDRHNGTFVQV